MKHCSSLVNAIIFVLIEVLLFGHNLNRLGLLAQNLTLVKIECFQSLFYFFTMHGCDTVVTL